MRTFCNACLFVIFSAAVVGSPALASPANPASAPLGVVLQADNAQVGADITAGGATIYDGDRLQTENGGTLRAQLGGPQMYLRQSSVAFVHGLPNGFSAELGAGSVVVSANKGQTFQLVADGATIRPAGADGAIAQITRVNASQLVLTSTKGALEIIMGDEIKTMEAGSSYRLDVTEEEESGPPPQGPYHTGRRRRFAMFLIIGGVAAATGILVWRAVESPSGF